jgi:hypothetical protein
MSVLRRKVWATRQNPGPPGINSAHPSAPSILSIATPGGIALPGSSLWYSSGSSQNGMTTTSQGESFNFGSSSSAAGMKLPANTIGQQTGAGTTQIAETRIAVVCLLASNSMLRTISCNNTATSSLVWSVNSTGNIVLRTAGGSTILTTTKALSQGVPAVVALQCTPQGGINSNFAVYINGVLDTSVSFSGSVPASSAPNIGGFCFGSGSGNCAQNILAIPIHVAWGRTLAANEIQDLGTSSNVYALTAPTSRRFALAATGAPTLSAATMFGITSSGGYPRVTYTGKP